GSVLTPPEGSLRLVTWMIISRIARSTSSKRTLDGEWTVSRGEFLRKAGRCSFGIFRGYRAPLDPLHGFKQRTADPQARLYQAETQCRAADHHTRLRARPRQRARTQDAGSER